MPELPEVEIIKRSLSKIIKGKIIKKVIVKNRNLRFKVPLNFSFILRNKKVIKVNRFSKYLILFLSNHIICLIHLGMSGTIHLIYKKNKRLITNTSFYQSPILPKKHNHIEILFENFRLVYNDPRRFGYFQILKNIKILDTKLNKFGPEPFDKKFNLNYLSSFLKGKEKNIKNFLLDQNFVSGIGNIYASEILYLSRINPDKKGKNLTKAELKKILINSKKVLSKAIHKGGSSIRDFRSISGLKGGYQNEFKVYQRESAGCKRLSCKGIIKKKNISNRSTFFCNYCQK